MSLYNHFSRIPPVYNTGHLQEKGLGMCKRFMQGKCPFSALSCPYSHNKDLAPLCSRWKAGECQGNMGNNCLYRHYYLERDAVTRFPPVRTPLAQVQPTANFSSPLTMRVIKETIQHKRVEVDIETGKRRSWVEEESRDVMDLTGDTDTPVKRTKTEETPLITPQTSPKKIENKSNKSPSTPISKKTTPNPSPSSTTSLSSTSDSTVKSPSSSSSSSSCSTTVTSLTISNISTSSLDPNTCPVCGKSGFKGSKGVEAHRNHKKSKCKNNQKINSVWEEAVQRQPAMNEETSSVTTATSPQTPVNNSTEVIEILDTPTPAPVRQGHTRDTSVVIVDTPDSPVVRTRAPRRVLLPSP